MLFLRELKAERIGKPLDVAFYRLIENPGFDRLELRQITVQHHLHPANTENEAPQVLLPNRDLHAFPSRHKPVLRPLWGTTGTSLATFLLLLFLLPTTAIAHDTIGRLTTKRKNTGQAKITNQVRAYHATWDK